MERIMGICELNMTYILICYGLITNVVIQAWSVVPCKSGKFGVQENLANLTLRQIKIKHYHIEENSYNHPKLTKLLNPVKFS